MEVHELFEEGCAGMEGLEYGVGRNRFCPLYMVLMDIMIDRPGVSGLGIILVDFNIPPLT